MAGQTETNDSTRADSLLIGAVPEIRAVTDADACRAYAADGIAPRTVLFPQSAEAVAQSLKQAAEQGLAVIPCRNATKLQTGNIPLRYDVALCLKEMNAVWRCDPADLTATVEPGMKLGDFQHMLARHGLWLPLDPPGGMKSSLGGIVAANAAGPLRLKYGAPRDFVLGMKIATTSGKIIKAGGAVVKNVAGYDLCRLLTGSWGTLGVIVEISIKLFPLPAGKRSWRAPVVGVDAARDLRRKILDSPLSPARMVLLDPGAAAVVSEDESGNWETWIEFYGSECVLRRSDSLLRELGPSAGAAFHSLEAADAEAGWNRITGFAPILPRRDSDAVVLRASLPIAASEEFAQQVSAEMNKTRTRCACLCQNGLGIVHAWLTPETLSTGLTTSIERLRQRAIERGGALVIERCPAEMKRDIDVWGPPGSDFDLMRKLKQLWDPAEILSPGRFVGRL